MFKELTDFISITGMVYIFSGAITVLAVLCGSAIGWFKKQEKEFAE